MGQEKIKIQQRTLAALEWHQLLEVISQNCVSEQGIQSLLTLNPYQNLHKSEFNRTLIADLLNLFTQDFQSPPLSHLVAVDDILNHITRHGIASLDELRSIKSTITCITACKEWCSSLPTDSFCFTHVNQLPDLSHLLSTYESIIGEDGQLKDTASWDLVQLQKQLVELDKTITSQLQALVQNFNEQGLLNDTFYTIRAGRYVLPVKSEFRSKVDGILHDISQTHKTAFIEPTSIIKLGNKIVAIQSEISQEQQRICAQLSSETLQFSEPISTANTLLQELDVLHAVAKFFTTHHGHMPAISQDQSIFLEHIRHPLLLGKTTKVVSNSISLDETTQATLITGPNAGGKTVLLKAIGLLALCQKAGFPFTIGADSSFPQFEHIMVSIGDEQSIESGLSTFSAHIKELSEFITFMKSTQESKLLIVDELISGTEPTQGAALARAVIEGCFEYNTQVYASTHYTTLKIATQEDKRFHCIAMGFDTKSGTPNYLATQGGFGGSNPFAIAAHVGMSRKILERAKSLADPKLGQLEQLLAQQHELLKQVEQQKSKLDEFEEQLQLQKQKLHKERQKYNKQKKQIEADVKQDLQQEIEDVRKHLSNIIADIQKTTGNSKERMQKAQLSQVALTKLKKQWDTHDPHIDYENHVFKVGQYVLVQGLGETIFTIESIDERKSNAQVRGNRLKANYPLSLLIPSTKKGKPIHTESSRTKQIQKAFLSDSKSQQETPKGLRIDVRGLRVDEALSACEKFLDYNYEQGIKQVMIIHGHGEGALKEAIRSYCRQSPYISRISSGHQSEGGDGVSVVEFN